MPIRRSPVLFPLSQRNGRRRPDKSPHWLIPTSWYHADAGRQLPGCARIDAPERLGEAMVAARDEGAAGAEASSIFVSYSRIDQKAALEAIPSMIPPDLENREKAYELIQQVLRARGELSADDGDRMKEIARLFGLEAGTAKSHLREIGKKPQAKAS